MRPPAARERGAAFLLVIGFFLVASIMTMNTHGVLQALYNDTPRDRAAFHAVLVADGAVAKARAALARDPDWSGGRVSVGRGEAGVAVETSGASADVRRVVVIADHPGGGAAVGGARLRVEVLLRLRGRRLPAILSWIEGAGPR